MEKTSDNSKRIRVGISHGDFNGISYEIIIKAIQDQRMLETCTVIIYGSSKIASYYKKLMNLDDINFNVIKKPEQAQPRHPNIINIVEEEVKIDIGCVTSIAGEQWMCYIHCRRTCL